MKIYYENPDMEQCFISDECPLCTSGEMQGTAGMDDLKQEDWNFFGEK